MVRRQQAADRAVRPKLRSPGHPKYQRHVEVAFWEQIAQGLLAEEAAGVVGVAPAVESSALPQPARTIAAVAMGAVTRAIRQMCLM